MKIQYTNKFKVEVGKLFLKKGRGYRMRINKYFFNFVILSVIFFSIPSNSMSKPLLYGGSKDEGNSPIFDPICMVTILEKVSYCPMNQQDTTGSVCICHNQLRTFSGFVLTRQEYTALCGSWPHGSCSKLDPGSELIDVQDESSEPHTETALHPDNSSPSDAFTGDLPTPRNEPSFLQSENSTDLQADYPGAFETRHSTLVTIPIPIPLLDPIEPDQLDSDLLEPVKVETDFEEILRRHPLRLFKNPTLLEIITDKKN